MASIAAMGTYTMVGSIASKCTSNHEVNELNAHPVSSEWITDRVTQPDLAGEAFLVAISPSYDIDFPAPAIECEYVIERSVGQAEQDEAAGVLFMDEEQPQMSESLRMELDNPKSWMPWDGQCDDFVLGSELRKRIMKWESPVGRRVMMNWDDEWFEVQIAKVHRSDNGIITVDVKGEAKGPNGRQYEVYGLELDLLKPL